MRPNVVLVMTDQQRADFTRGAGFELDTMPFLDELGAAGTRYERGYTVLPACVPARCSLLTGRFPKATGVRENHAAPHIRRGADLVDVFRDAGYSTLFAGKTHFHRRPEDFDRFAGPYFHTRGPADRGTPDQHRFEEWLHALDHGAADEPSPYGIEAQFPYRIVDDAIAMLDTRPPDRPFLGWLSFPEPHNPYQVPEPYFDLFPPDAVPERSCGPEAVDGKGDAWRWLRDEMERKRPGYDRDWRRYRSNYCGMLRLIDDQVRRFVAALEDRGLRDDTVIWFVSDHGDYVGDYGLQRKGAGMPECLMRVPYQVTGPGIRAHHDSTNFVSLVDLLPTLCELIGAEIPAGVQGRSLVPLLTGEVESAEEFATIHAECGIGGLPYPADARPELDPVRDYDYRGRPILELNSVTQSGNTAMVRRADWKLLYDNLGRGELYDLADDPAELHNRFDDPQVHTIRDHLMADLLRWTIRTDDPLPLEAYRPRRGPHNWYDTTGVTAGEGLA